MLGPKRSYVTRAQVGEPSMLSSEKDVGSLSSVEPPVERGVSFQVCGDDAAVNAVQQEEMSSYSQVFRSSRINWDLSVLVECDPDRAPYSTGDLIEAFRPWNCLPQITHIGPLVMNYVQVIKFSDSASAKDFLLRKSVMVKGKPAKIVTLKQSEVTVRLSWVLPETSDGVIQAVFRKYGKVSKIVSPSIAGQDCAHIKTTTRFVVLCLNEGVELVHLPYQLRLDGGKVLVTVPGRPPRCFFCSEIGHVRKFCLNRKDTAEPRGGSVSQPASAVRSFADVVANVFSSVSEKAVPPSISAKSAAGDVIEESASPDPVLVSNALPSIDSLTPDETCRASQAASLVADNLSGSAASEADLNNLSVPVSASSRPPLDWSKELVEAEVAECGDFQPEDLSRADCMDLEAGDWHFEGSSLPETHSASFASPSGPPPGQSVTTSISDPSRRKSARVGKLSDRREPAAKESRRLGLVGSPYMQAKLQKKKQDIECESNMQQALTEAAPAATSLCDSDFRLLASLAATRSGNYPDGVSYSRAE